MKEYERMLPECGLYRNNTSVDNYDEEEEMEICSECRCIWDDEEMGAINYTMGGREYICCADCFFAMIGWADSMVHKRDDNKLDYEFALDILLHRDTAKTGINIIDNHSAEMIAYLKRMVEILGEQEEIKKAMREMKGVA